MIQPASSAALPDRHAKLTHQAQRLVGQTFYGTLLKQMHNSPFKSKILDGGRGAEAFQPLMDQHLIDRMSRSAGKKLVNSIVKHIERNDAKKAAAPAQTPPLNLPNGLSTPEEMRLHVPHGLRA
jgi:Rod binding domain-containing protein